MARTPVNNFLFVGPTLWGTPISVRRRASASGWRLMEPVRRGDIDHVTSRSDAAGCIGIVDGVLGEELSITHNEILRAIDRGWKVFGISSIGAIRAAELSGEGMRGAGWVYDQFIRNPAITDDEVVHFHTPFRPYEYLTEPLIHLRYFYDRICSVGMLSQPKSEILIEEFKRKWFGERTLEAYANATIKVAELGQEANIREAFERFSHYRIKRIDVETFLGARQCQ